MKENKLTTYLLYAIGEIILVVVGILIAVSIDNWNDEQLEKEEMSRAIASLMIELKADTTSLNSSLQVTQKELKITNLTLAKITSKDATLDSVIYAMRFIFNGYFPYLIKFRKTGFESLKTTGLFHQLPDSLQTEINRYYINQEYTSERLKDVRNVYLQRMIKYDQKWGSDDSPEIVNKYVWLKTKPEEFLPNAHRLVATHQLLFTIRKDLHTDISNQNVRLLRNLEKFLLTIDP